MTTMRTYTLLPSPQSGYELDDQFSVVMPITRTNLVINPSFETNTTGWTAIGGSVARTTVQQYHGAYSLAITPTAATTDGVRFDTVSLIAGQLYAYSAKVLGSAGKSYKLAIETTGALELASVTFVATGRWQWVYGYYAEASTTTRRVTLRKAGGADTIVFYLDGAQVEAINVGESVSTYLDGAQLGFVPNQSPPAYVWNGTPHASTSTRSGLTRAGGTVVRFKDFGFLLTAIIGLGLATPMNAATEYARIDGGYDDYTRKPTRQFTLSGQFQAGLDYLQLRQYRGGLSRLLDRDLVGLDQRLLLKREVVDPCGVTQSSTCQVIGKYQGGLGGNTDNQVAESTAITFTQYLPSVLSDGEVGASLTVQQTITGTDRVAERQNSGQWRAIGTGANGSVNAVIYAPNGLLYFAGDFTAPATRVASWDGTTVSALSTGLNASVRTLVVGPDGSLYAGGVTFTVAGNTGSVAKWNGSAWAIVGATGTMTNRVDQLLFAPDGTLYAGGMNGGTSKATLDSWNGTTWTNVFTSAAAGNSEFFALARGLDGRLFAGGVFSNLNGDANQDAIASLKGGVWSALGTGLNGNIEDQGLTIGQDGKLYVIGNFTTAGGVSALSAAVWNGVSWNPMGAGLTGQALEGSAITLSDGTIVMGGSFTGSAGVTFPDPLARWNGATFVALDANLPTDVSNNVLTLAAAIDGRFAVGYNNTGSTTAAGITILTNPGTARSYPTVTINGPSSGTARIYQVVNTTTGRAIYLNLTLNVGEVATLVFQPDNLSFTSTFQGDISSSILPGSNTADFFLEPGANTISFFSASSTVTATLFFRPAYASLDDVP